MSKQSDSSPLEFEGQNSASENEKESRNPMSDLPKEKQDEVREFKERFCSIKNPIFLRFHYALYGIRDKQNEEVSFWPVVTFSNLHEEFEEYVMEVYQIPVSDEMLEKIEPKEVLSEILKTRMKKRFEVMPNVYDCMLKELNVVNGDADFFDGRLTEAIEVFFDTFKHNPDPALQPIGLRVISPYDGDL